MLLLIALLGFLNAGISASPCTNPDEVISKLSGWFVSPGYNNMTNYPKNVDCTWKFLAPRSKVYKFSIVAFDLEKSTPCIYDYLKVTEFETYQNAKKSKVLTVLCGFEGPFDDITPSAPEVRFNFKSDDQAEGLGFNITYRLVPEPFKCSSYQWKCGKADRCIAKSKVCDGKKDCVDGSDEIICPNSYDCGTSVVPQKLISGRIFGGQLANKGSWPWAVGLNDGGFSHRCGATIIHPNWVLTAYHCFLRHKVSNDFIRAGNYDRHKSDREQQIRYIKQVFKLKSFDSISKRDDIALVQLKNPFSITDYVKPACLPLNRVREGTNGWIVGWGSDYNDQTTRDFPCCETKQKQAMLPVMSKSVCNSPDYYGGQVYQHMMCVGLPKGTPDSCKGDSGGPFLTKRVTGGRWEVQGVTSWGPDGCGVPKKPGVYTVVYDYIDWIRRTIADNHI